MNPYATQDTILWIIFWSILLAIPLWGFWCLYHKGSIYVADNYILNVAPYSPEAKRIRQKRENGTYPYEVPIPRRFMQEYWDKYGYDPNVPAFRKEWERLHNSDHERR